MMAFRYIALFCTGPAAMSEAREAILHATPLPLVYENAGLTIFASDLAGVLPLRSGAGAIIGTLFTRSACPAPIHTLDDSNDRRIAATAGEDLVNSAWGGYVTFVSPRSGEMSVMRDPSGALPCYAADAGNHTIFASDIETLLEAGIDVPAVSWSFVGRHLFAYDLRTPETGLTGLREIAAGTRLSISAGGSTTSSAWSPWDYAGTGQRRRTGEAADALLETVSGCVRAWAAGHSHVLLGVSGGLDSSVIASCLASGPSALTCLTMATREGEGDERHYARMLAEHMGLDLVEAFHDLRDIDVTQSTSRHLPRPVLCAFAQSEFRTRLALAGERGIDALFTGIGGDNVFCLLQSASAIIDRLRTQGPVPGVLQTLFDTCRLTSCSLGEAISMAIRRNRRSGHFVWHGDTRFLAPGTTTALAGDLTHPWLTPSEAPLPGKAAHVAMLVRIQATTDGLSRHLVPQINPLLSQPIAELCLSIPTWEWSAGGANRAVVREAFREKLPQALLARRSKGGPNSFAYEVVSENRGTIRDMLCGGLLASEGLIDVDEVARALPADGPIRGYDHMRLSLLAETEAWAMHWTAMRRSRASGSRSRIFAEIQSGPA